MTFTSIALIVGLLAQAPPAQNSLRIVVVEGEDAVNIIQQKTAVAPIIEVRDRNNLPVAGASVTFALGGNTASFAGGVQTLTVVTNSAGQAVAAGISPLTSGAVQINVTAAFQGQTAIATITQTNVLTAAQAAGAASSTAGGGTGGGSGAAGTGAGTGSTGASTAGAAGGAAGGAGGGLSGLAIGGIVGGAAAVAGGVLVATGGGDDSSSSSTSSTTSTSSPTTSTPTTTTPTTSQPTTVSYTGPLSGIYTSTGSAENITCTFTYNVTGTMRIDLTTQSGGSVTGTGSGTMSFREAGGQCTVPFPFSVDPDGSESGSLPFTGSVSGTTSSFRFSQSQTQNIPITGGSGSSTFETSFTGSLSGGTITGQVALTQSTTLTIPGISNIRGSGTGSMTVTLRP
jgi:hypothetical protein